MGMVGRGRKFPSSFLAQGIYIVQLLAVFLLKKTPKIKSAPISKFLSPFEPGGQAECRIEEFGALARLVVPLQDPGARRRPIKVRTARFGGGAADSVIETRFFLTRRQY